MESLLCMAGKRDLMGDSGIRSCLSPLNPVFAAATCASCELHDSSFRTTVKTRKVVEKIVTAFTLYSIYVL